METKIEKEEHKNIKRNGNGARKERKRWRVRESLWIKMVVMPHGVVGETPR